LGNLAGLVKSGKNPQIPAFSTLPEAKLHISIEKREANPKFEIPHGAKRRARFGNIKQAPINQIQNLKWLTPAVLVIGNSDLKFV
jgi:hypothetical protein